MTPKAFDLAMAILLKSSSYEQVAESGFKLIADELGEGMVAYVPSIDQLCRRLRELHRGGQISRVVKPVSIT